MGIERVINNLILDKYPHYAGVILTGSYTSNLNNEHSDIDLIILSDDIQKISRVAHNDYNGYDVDVILIPVRKSVSLLINSIYAFEDALPTMLLNGKVFYEDHRKLATYLTEYARKTVLKIYKELTTYTKITGVLEVIQMLIKDYKYNNLSPLENHIVYASIIDNYIKLKLQLAGGFLGKNKHRARALKQYDQACYEVLDNHIDNPEVTIDLIWENLKSYNNVSSESSGHSASIARYTISIPLKLLNQQTILKKIKRLVSALEYHNCSIQFWFEDDDSIMISTIAEKDSPELIRNIRIVTAATLELPLDAAFYMKVLPVYVPFPFLKHDEQSLLENHLHTMTKKIIEENEFFANLADSGNEVFYAKCLWDICKGVFGFDDSINNLILKDWEIQFSESRDSDIVLYEKAVLQAGITEWDTENYQKNDISVSDFEKVFSAEIANFLMSEFIALNKTIVSLAESNHIPYILDSILFHDFQIESKVRSKIFLIKIFLERIFTSFVSLNSLHEILLAKKGES